MIYELVLSTITWSHSFILIEYSTPVALCHTKLSLVMVNENVHRKEDVEMKKEIKNCAEKSKMKENNELIENEN